MAIDRYSLWLETVVRLAGSADVAVVGATTQVADAIAMLEQQHPDLFIVGLERAGGGPDGAEALMKAAAQVSGMATLIVSTDDDSEFVEHCLAAGADAYALKTIDPEDLSTAIRQSVDRCVYLFGRPPKSKRADPTTPEQTASQKLTARETDVLRLVAEGYANAEVAKQLWISVPTVKFHLSRIYAKLGVPNRTAAAHWIDQAERRNRD